jgi:hypothetical protein
VFMYGPASFNFRSEVKTLKDFEGKKVASSPRRSKPSR